VERDDWNNWNFGTLGTCGRLKHFERSAAIEQLEQLERTVSRDERSLAVERLERLRESLDFSHCLDLMTVQPKADRPSAETGVDVTVRHQLIENRGALVRDHEIRRIDKREQRNSHRNVCAS
jgi:hypothetical protein